MTFMHFLPPLPSSQILQLLLANCAQQGKPLPAPQRPGLGCFTSSSEITKSLHSCQGTFCKKTEKKKNSTQ